MANPTGSGSSQDDRLMAALAYIGLFIILVPTILIFLSKKDQSPFIKRHCLQAMALAVALIVINVVLTVLFGVLGTIPVVNIIAGLGGLLLFPLLGLGTLILILWLAYKAYQGGEARLPVITDWVEARL